MYRNANSAFNNFVNTVFGANAITLDETLDNRNNVIGAIERFYSNGDYSFFTSNLKKRLHRLRENIPVAHRATILNKIRNLSQDNWMGYYSELVAYDFFALLFREIDLEIQVAATETFAGGLHARQNSSIDGRILDFPDLHFEVKSLQDNLETLLNRLANNVGTLTGNHIQITNFPADANYANIASNFRQITTDLVQLVRQGSQVLTHITLPNITFTVDAARPQVTTTISTSNPFRLASELKHLPLIHFDQILMHRPNMLVYVIFPWFNLITNDFSDFDKIFFRSFARRLFCELSRDNSTLAMIDPLRFPNNNQTISSVVENISFIVFLIDNSVEPAKAFNSNDQISTIEGYVYSNPNASQRSRIISLPTFLESMDTYYSSKIIRYTDSFEDDNY